MTAPAVPSIFDMSNLAALKGAVKKDDPQALKSAAQQFEALFMQMVMKSMRDATPREGMFDSEQTRMFESLLDQQMAQVVSAKSSTGLAALIEKQLLHANADAVGFPDGLPLTPPAPTLPLDHGRPLPLEGVNGAPRFIPLDRTPTLPALPGLTGAAASGGVPAMTRSASSASANDLPPSGDSMTPAAREFVARVWPDAVEASRTTGVPASFMVAQAALETGWGRAEPRLADGRPSNNLFGIKAGRNWNGATAESATTEYVEGVATRQTERFRAYGSQAESFRDYANLLSTSPRYAAVMGTQNPAAFAQGLQRAGYATDPQYAEKLTRIIGSLTPSTTLG